MDVAGRVEPRRGPAERSPEPLPRGTALGAAAQEEIQGDRIQAGARQRAAAMGADRADQPDREMAAALGPLPPVDGHAAASPLASRPPSSRITRKRQQIGRASWREGVCQYV